MTQRRTFAIVALAVLAILLSLASVGAAHGNETDHDDAPVDGGATGWGDWMDQHMIEHMGEDAADQMRERMGMDHDEMSRMMEGMTDDEMGSMMGGESSGMGCH